MQELDLPSPPRADSDDCVSSRDLQTYVREVLPDVDHKSFLGLLSLHLYRPLRPVAIPAQPAMRTTHHLGLICIPSEEFSLRAAIDAQVLTSSKGAVNLITKVARSRCEKPQDEGWIESAFQDDTEGALPCPMSPPIVAARRQIRPASREELFSQAQQLVDLPLVPFEPNEDLDQVQNSTTREDMLAARLAASASQMAELKQLIQLARPPKSASLAIDDEGDEPPEPVLHPLSPPLLPRGKAAMPVGHCNVLGSTSSVSDLASDALAGMRDVGPFPTKFVDSLLVPGSRAEAVCRWNDWDDIELPPDTSSLAPYSASPSEVTTQATSVRAEPSAASVSGRGRDPMSDSTLSLNNVSELPDLTHDDVIFSSARALPGRVGSAPRLGAHNVSTMLRELQSVPALVEPVPEAEHEQALLARDQPTAVEVAQREKLACPPGALFWLDGPDLPRPHADDTDSLKLPLALKDLLGSRDKKQRGQLAPAPGLHSLNIELPHVAFQVDSSTANTCCVYNEELIGDQAVANACWSDLSSRVQVSTLSSESSTPHLALSSDEYLLRVRIDSRPPAQSTTHSQSELDSDEHSVASLNPPISQREHARQLSDALARLAGQAVDHQHLVSSQQESQATIGTGMEFIESPSTHTELGSASQPLAGNAETKQDGSTQQSVLLSSPLQQPQSQRRLEAEKEEERALLRAVRSKKSDVLRGLAVTQACHTPVARMDTYLLMRGQNFKNFALHPPSSSPAVQQSSREEAPTEEIALASPKSLETVTDWPRHRYVATSRSIKNHAVLSALRNCNVDIVERKGLDADIWLDASSACIFFKLSLLPAALAPGTQGVADLSSMLQSPSHTRVLLILEQYSSTGNAVQLSPPLQNALAELPDWIDSQVVSLDKSVERVIVKSPMKAATCCREWGSKLEAEAASLAPVHQVDQQVTAPATWRARTTWLTDEPYADEAYFFSTCVSCFAAILVVAVRGSAKTFIQDSLDHKLWQFGKVLSEQIIRQLDAQLQEAEES